MALIIIDSVGTAERILKIGLKRLYYSATAACLWLTGKQTYCYLCNAPFRLNSDCSSIVGAVLDSCAKCQPWMVITDLIVVLDRRAYIACLIIGSMPDRDMWVFVGPLNIWFMRDGRYEHCGLLVGFLLDGEVWSSQVCWTEKRGYFIPSSRLHIERNRSLIDGVNSWQLRVLFITLSQQSRPRMSLSSFVVDRCYGSRWYVSWYLSRPTAYFRSRYRIDFCSQYLGNISVSVVGCSVVHT